jgi:prepilin-type N-terminal cleavage/methylation domain-containing protein
VPRRRPGSRSAFTLIELLVVIAIIAILAAILFPVFAKVRKRAHMTTCVSNNKQMGLAMLQYAQDYDDTMPLWIPSGALPGATSPPGDTSLRQNYGFLSLQPYIKNTAIFDDPECEQWDEPGGTKYTPNKSLANEVPVDYRFNTNGDINATTRESFKMAGNEIRSGGTLVGYSSLTLGDCTFPAQFFMISDRHTQHHTDSTASGVSTVERNRYLMPMVFADGHAKPMRIYALQDSKGNYKPYHWKFPQCHPGKDDLILNEYNGG